MRTAGVVLALTGRPHGSYLQADAPAGTTVLTVEATDDFAEEGGTLELPAGTQLVYSSADIDLGTVTLAAPLAAGLVTGDFVATIPRAVSWEADVEGPDGDTITADVPHYLVPLMAEGISPPELAQGVSLEELDPGEWVVADIIDERPDIPFDVLDPDTIPPPPAPTDGLAPTSSPTPVVQGAIGALAVVWPGITNPDPVLYEVHCQVAAVQPGLRRGTIDLEPEDRPALRDFPGPAAVDSTYVGEVAGTSFWVRRTAAGLPLVPGTMYEVWTVAKDGDGEAPPSAVVSGTPAQAAGADILANAITAEHLLAGAVQAEHLEGTLILGTTIIAGDPATQHVLLAGQVGLQLISAAGNPLINLPTNPGQPAFFRGQLEAVSLDVLQSLVVRGVDNILGPGSVLTLKGTLSAPAAAPTVKVDWERQQLQPSDVVYRGLAWDAAGDGGAGSWWVGEDTVDANGTASWVVAERRASDLSVLRYLGGGNPRWGYVRSIARVGAHVYVASAFVYTLTISKYLASTGALVATTPVTSMLTQDSNGHAGAFSIGQDGATLLLQDAASITGWTWAPRIRTFTMSDAGVITFTGTTVLATRTSWSIFAQPWVIGAEGSYWLAAAGDPTYGDQAWAWTKAGVATSDREFPYPGGSVGITHDGTRFWTLAGTELIRHTTWDWTTESARYWVGSTWWEDVH